MSTLVLKNLVCSLVLISFPVFAHHDGDDADHTDGKEKEQVLVVEDDADEAKETTTAG